MTKEVVGNYIRAHRRRLNLSQLELGRLVGYNYGSVVGRHERSSAAPPLLIALAYEVVFEVPVAQLFTGFYATVAQAVARNLAESKTVLESETSGHRRSNLAKNQWLFEKRVG